MDTKSTDEPLDFDFDEMLRQASAVLETGGVNEIFQRYTCSNCGVRATCDIPNKFFEIGTCPQCHHETNLRENGCNFLVRLELKIDGAEQSENNNSDRAAGSDRPADPS